MCACAYERLEWTERQPDVQLFEMQVYPLMLRDCAFFACHGNTDRFLRIFGPGRTRISAKLEAYDSATEDEIHLTYERARSMLDGVANVEDSLLLRKVLDANAGGAGAGHRGRDLWAHNVYRSREDLAYQTLLAWARSEQGSATKGVDK